MFIITNAIITTRVNVSLHRLPPIIFGTITYHAETAVKYQILTNVCPKAQNRVRATITFIVSTHPKAQGIIVNTSIATGILPKNKSTNTPVAKNEKIGRCLPLLFFLQLAIFINAPNAHIQTPKTINTRPI